MQAIVVVTTVGTEEQAYLIAREIVARRQAACVNVLPGIRSVYRWKGKICKDGELLLVIKTLAEEFEGVSATIRLPPPTPTENRPGPPVARLPPRRSGGIEACVMEAGWEIRLSTPPRLS